MVSFVPAFRQLCGASLFPLAPTVPFPSQLLPSSLGHLNTHFSTHFSAHSMRGRRGMRREQRRGGSREKVCNRRKEFAKFGKESAAAESALDCPLSVTHGWRKTSAVATLPLANWRAALF